MFDKIFAMVTSLFGVASLPKDKEGKSILTSEMETQITEKWGAKFLESFKKDLADAEANGNDPSKSADVVKLQKQLEDMKSKFDAALAENTTLKTDKEDLAAKVKKLSLDPEDDNPEIIEMTQGKKKTEFRPNMAYMHNKVIDNYFNGDGTMQYSTDTTIDTAELRQEFGLYVSAAKVDILKSINYDLEVTKYMTTVVTDKTEWRAAQGIITSILQQFTPYWTPSGKTKFTPITIKNYILKVNLPIKPADIIDQYIGYMYDENLTPDQMPITKYIINELMLPQLNEDLELALANAKFVEHTVNADGAAGSSPQDSMDGFMTIIRRLRSTAGNQVTWLLPGVTLTPDNIVAEMEKAVDAVPYKYKSKKMLIHADPDIITMYRRAYRALYPVTKNEDEDKLRVDFSNFTFAPVAGMIGTGAFFITPKQNFIHLMSRNPNEAKIFMQVQNYDVKVFMEFRQGTGFAMQEALFAYLPDVSGSAGSTGGGL